MAILAPMVVSKDASVVIAEMKATCKESYHYRDGNLENKCGKLIDDLDARGFETLSKGDDFWVEQ